MPLLACACSHIDAPPEPPRIVGDSPRDVASSIVRLREALPANRQAVFGQAVMTLTLVSPDKRDERTIGYMTPHFARMVSGRNAEQIIQIADVYRASIPIDRP